MTGKYFRPGCLLLRNGCPGSSCFQMDARRIPFREEFDVIGAFDVLEHVKEDEEVLSQVYQAMRKRGGILVPVPHHPAPDGAARLTIARR